MKVVVDASVVAAALLDTEPTGRWAEALLQTTRPVSTHLMPAEVTNLLRRHVRAGKLSDERARLALSRLEVMRVEYCAFVPHWARVWSLRGNVSAYDAWYVALAEALQAPLATLDMRLVRAPGPRCRFIHPEP